MHAVHLTHADHLMHALHPMHEGTVFFRDMAADKGRRRSRPFRLSGSFVNLCEQRIIPKLTYRQP